MDPMDLPLEYSDRRRYDGPKRERPSTVAERRAARFRPGVTGIRKSDDLERTRQDRAGDN